MLQRQREGNSGSYVHRGQSGSGKNFFRFFGTDCSLLAPKTVAGHFGLIVTPGSLFQTFW